MNKISSKYPIIREIKQRRKERKQFFLEAVDCFNKEKPIHGSLFDYKKALWQHRVSYREYMYGYEFWKLNEKERNDFISQREMWCIYRKTIHTKVRKVLADKVCFLNTFKQFVHRDWIYPKNVSFESFVDFVSSHACIAKPLFGEQGKDIHFIANDNASNLQELYSYYCDNDYLLEEKVRACCEIEAFHPQSLNTIRIVTLSGKGKCKIMGALLRMGANNSIVDNTSSGGIVAVIDVESGETVTDGFDIEGVFWKYHPNSGIRIKGFSIPNWEQCIEVVKKASQVIPDCYFTGWDVCILENGQIELIEGNSAPDVNGGIQAPYKTGFKKKLQTEGKEIMGFDPISLISVWSRSYKKYE